MQRTHIRSLRGGIEVRHVGCGRIEGPPRAGFISSIRCSEYDNGKLLVNATLYSRQERSPGPQLNDVQLFLEPGERLQIYIVLRAQATIAVLGFSKTFLRLSQCFVQFVDEERAIAERTSARLPLAIECVLQALLSRDTLL